MCNDRNTVHHFYRTRLLYVYTVPICFSGRVCRISFRGSSCWLCNRCHWTKDGKCSFHLHNWVNRSEPHSHTAGNVSLPNAKYQFMLIYSHHACSHDAFNFMWVQQECPGVLITRQYGIDVWWKRMYYLWVFRFEYWFYCHCLRHSATRHVLQGFQKLGVGMVHTLCAYT